MNIKKYIKKVCPRIYIFLRNIYHSSMFYKNRIKKEELKKLENQRKKYQKNIKIINDLFSGNYFVRYGPFRGMKYIKNSSGSPLLPKILGSYEEPIQKWIEEAIDKKYKKIINIGSAKGYYAVGFAFKSKDALVYAYDINPSTRELCQTLSKLNNVENRVIIRSLCSHNNLEKLLTSDTLIICDIEGAEEKLLDPKKIPSLKNTDMIVESHDFIINHVTNLLVKSFFKTHKIEIVVDYERNVKMYPILLEKKNFIYINKVLDERRPERMCWLRLTGLDKESYGKN